MSDAPVVHIGENSPEQVAYRLMHEIATQEGAAKGSHSVIERDRAYVLDLYHECFLAVRGLR